MITGYVRNATGNWLRHDALDELIEAWKTTGQAIWVDLDGDERAALEQLAPVLDVAPDAIEDAYEGEQRARIDEYADHLFLLTYGILGPDPELEFGGRKLAMFFDERMLITAHRLPLRALDNIHDAMARNKKLYKDRGTDFLLYGVLDGLVDNYLFFADRQEDYLDQLEDLSLSPDCDAKILGDLADVRSDLLEARKRLTALREVVLPLKYGQLAHIDEKLQTRFQHVFDHIIQAQEEVENLREVVHGIRDNYFAMISDRTNQFIKTLTIFATFMLPLTFIAGLYGMNVPLWPPPDSPWTTVSVLGVMAALTVGMLYYFRRKRWM